jgi:NAD+ synthase
MRPIKLARINQEQVEREIQDFIIKEVVQEARTGGVLGMSGGVDSTLVAALAKGAFDRYNNLDLSQRMIYKPILPRQNLELVGYMLPSKLNSPDDAKDAVTVAEKLGVRYQIINLEDAVQGFKTTNPEVFQGNGKATYDKGNMISEIRAVVLHTKAAHENKLVIGTGNRDEDFNLAFYTLFGDGAVRISPIAGLPKRLVRQLAAYKGFADLAKRVSSPGLEPGQTSFGTLGYEYETSEVVIEAVLQNFMLQEIKQHPQVIEAIKEDIEKYRKLFGKKKFETVEEVVDDIMRRREIAKGKARVVSPPTPAITLLYD